MDTKDRCDTPGVTALFVDNKELSHCVTGVTPVGQMQLCHLTEIKIEADFGNQQSVFIWNSGRFKRTDWSNKMKLKTIAGLFDFLAIVVAFDVDDFAHFVKTRAKPYANSFSQSLVHFL